MNHVVTQPGDLQREAEVVLDRLRVAVADAVVALPNPIRRSADLSRELDLDAALGWSIFRVMRAPTALEAGPFIPGSGMMKRFLRCAEERGVPATRLQEIREAFEQFERLVERHAGDRASFTSIIRDVQGGEPGKDDLKHKRAAYRSNRHLCGAHAEATVHSVIVRPGADADRIDVAKLKGNVRMQRTRAGSSLLAETGMRVGAASAAAQQPRPIDFDENPTAAGMSLLSRFCSHPLPELRSFVDENGLLITQVHSRTLGKSGAATYFFAGLSRGVPLADDSGDPPRCVRSQITVPCEVFIRDVWVHGSMWPGDGAVAEMFWRGSAPADARLRDVDRLPISEEARFLGWGVKAGITPDVPDYPRIVTHVAEQLQWKIEEFRLFRARIEYPMLGAILRMGVATGGDR